MKKFMMMVAMAFATLTASAQAEAGTLTLKPLVGMNLSDITKGENKMKVGLAAGAELEYMLSDNASISAGAIYSMQGCKGKGEESNVKYNFDYINIPILANYYFAKGFAVKAGVQPAFKVSSKAKADGASENLDGYKSFDLAIPLGLSYEISNFVIDARYNLSLTKIHDDVEGVEYGKNQVIQITLGYKFAL